MPTPEVRDRIREALEAYAEWANERLRQSVELAAEGQYAEILTRFAETAPLRESIIVQLVQVAGARLEGEGGDRTTDPVTDYLEIGIKSASEALALIQHGDYIGALTVFHRRAEEREHAMSVLVDLARHHNGASWAQIGRALGLHRSSAQQRFGASA